MPSPLIAISTADVNTKKQTISLLKEVFSKEIEHCFILITDQDLTHLSLLEASVNLYDISRQINGKEKSAITVLFAGDESERDFHPWDSVKFSKSVTLDAIPKSFFSAHIIPKPLEFEGEYGKQTREKGPGLNLNHFEISAVGGTFDHLHDGHRILLTIAAFITASSLIVGITGPELLKNKSYVEYMQDYTSRSDNVTRFLNLLRPNLHLNVQEINDVCGPTAEIKDINALIVSKESEAGGKFINNVRNEKEWSPLDIIIIDVIGGNEKDFKDKLSSTDYRRLEFERRKGV